MTIELIEEHLKTIDDDRLRRVIERVLRLEEEYGSYRKGAPTEDLMQIIKEEAGRT